MSVAEGRLEGRVALVTGGGRGLGRSIGLALAGAGANLVATDIVAENAEAVAAEAKELGVESLALRSDVSDHDSVNEMVQKTVDTFGKVDILINNAGITKDTLLMRMSDDQWNAVININLNGTYYCTQAVLRPMMKARYGRIISIASVVGVIGNAGQANYSASKAGIIGLTKSVAREVASRNITVNAVAPGFIDTDMTQVLSDEVKEGFLKNIPINRMGTVDDVSHVVKFLASDASSYLTGQVVNVDGGMVM